MHSHKHNGPIHLSPSTFNARAVLLAALQEFAAPQPAQPVPQPAQEPVAYVVYFPTEQRQEYCQDLDELIDDTTNLVHEVTPLYAAPQPAAQTVQPATAVEAMRLALVAFDKMTGRKPDFVETAIAALRSNLTLAQPVAQPDPIGLDSYDSAYQRGFQRGLEASSSFRDEAKAYKEAYFKLVENMASQAALTVHPKMMISYPVLEPLVRYCPDCGSIGPVPATARDCCPDGQHARMVPENFAKSCRETFMRYIAQPAAQTSKLNWRELTAWWESGSEHWGELKDIVQRMVQSQSAQPVAQPQPSTIRYALPTKYTKNGIGAKAATEGK